MKENRTVLSYRKIKGMEVLQTAYNHNYRKEGYAPNSDVSKQVNNEELVPDYDGRPYDEVLEERILASPYYKKTSVRKDAVTAVEFVVSFSRGAVDGMLIEAWKQANLEFFSKKYGSNLVSAVFHDDEITEHPDGVIPHIHVLLFTFSPIGSLRLKTIVPRNYTLTLLHSEYAEAMKPFGLSRGVYGSKSRHLDPWEYHQLFDEEVKSFKAGFPVKEIGDTDKEYLERVAEYSEKALREKIRLLFDATSEINSLRAELENREMEVDLDTIIAREKARENEVKINDMLKDSKNFKRTFEHLGLDINDINNNTPRAIKRARAIASMGHTAAYLMTSFPDRALADEVIGHLQMVRKYMKEKEKRSLDDLLR